MSPNRFNNNNNNNNNNKTLEGAKNIVRNNDKTPERIPVALDAGYRL